MHCLSFFRNQEGALSKYLKEVHKFPSLSQDEEFSLAKDWIDNKNQKSMNKLIKGHLRLVVNIAKGYSGYGIPISELISEGHIGILQAIDHYKPELGYRFSTYSAWWIKARIQDYVFNYKSMVKLGTTKAHKKLFFCLNKIKKMLGINMVSNDNVRQLSEKLSIKEETIIDADHRLSAMDFSLNAPINDNSAVSTWEEFIADDKASAEEIACEKQELKYRQNLFAKAMEHLSQRERDIVVWYRLNEPPLTLTEIGHKLGISKERVRQLEEKALFKIKEYIKRNS